MEKQDLAQMMKQMLARMDDIKEMKKEMKENQEKADAHQAKMEVKMGSMQAELVSIIKNFKFNGEETMACQETMEARLEEEKPASVDRTPEVAHGQEVPLEDRHYFGWEES
jgi:hypothetical protein